MKAKLRVVAKQKRLKIKVNYKSNSLPLKHINFCLDKIISNNANNINVAGLYYPMFDEISPLGFMEYFNANGITTSLPVVNVKTKSMLFKKWNLGDTLQKSHLGNLQPVNENKNIIPQMIVVPLLMFDRNLNRLGYGGGYYDRLISKLKKHFYKKKISFITIGLAYSGQETKSIPYDNHDEPLDFIITDKEFISK